MNEASTDPLGRAAGVTDNPWRTLGRHTPARIGLGRAGNSLPTAALLDFQLAHAQARDAVQRALDLQPLCAEIEALGLGTLVLHSAAATRAVYLQRPDLGRQLDGPSRARLDGLREQGVAQPPPRHDLALVVVDGLSALAVQRHAVPLLAALLPRLAAVGDAGDAARQAWRLAPVTVVEQGRVAVGDAIGELLDSAVVVVLIGERPGLSSPDSLGIYLTWAPRIGRSDAERNCISNVRPEGLAPADAAARLAWLLGEARRLRLSGIALKDNSSAARCLDVDAELPLLPPSTDPLREAQAKDSE